VTRSSWLAAALVASAFLAFHLPFLPSSLEDLDSINFALGLRDFDVARHQPHPTGYPVFVVLAKLVHAVGVAEGRALSLVNLVGGALAVFGCLGLFRALGRRQSISEELELVAVVLAVTCPLFWVTAGRPLSDAAGLAAALAVQAATLLADGPRGLTVTAAVAGVAAGIRSQVVWLTVPLLVFAHVRPGSRGRGQTVTRGIAAYTLGALSWFAPLVLVSGGPLAYWRALSSQGTEDLTGVAMLATTPTVSLAVETARSAFVAPWGWWPLAAIVLTMAAAGAVRLLRGDRAGLLVLALAFGPYLAFHLLFQEAITTRYALPLVVPVVYLAVHGVSGLPRLPALTLMVSLAGASVFLDDRVLPGYASMDAPAFRLLGDMHAARSPTPPVLAMHRKGEFDMRRPIQWVGSAMPAVAARLAAPPKHEWLELVEYWNSGGRAPVWFVADPPRSDLALIRYRGRPSFYRWAFQPTSLVGGARPNEMDWHVIEQPDWYLGEGWALTPETAGVAREDGKGPGDGPISAWVHRSPSPVTIMVGGRHLTPGGAPARVRVTVDGALLADWQVQPGFFLHILAPRVLAGRADYAHLTIESDSRDVAIEQFDTQPVDRVVFGFGDGWNELEYNPKTGALWRWSTDRATLRVRTTRRALALDLRGEIEAASTSRVIVRAGDAVVSEFEIGRSFARTVIVPATAVSEPETGLTIETSAWSVPAKTSWRSRDERRLGLKLFECRVSPAS
jgi:hypothetical protein